MKRETTAIALIVALAMAGMATAVIRAPMVQAASQYLNVAVTNNYPGDVPQYTLTFSAATTIHKGDLLTLTFDTEVARAKDGNPSSSDILFDGASSTSGVEWSGNKLKVSAPVDLVAGTGHVAVIMAGALIQNPRTAGHYQITLEHPVSGMTLISSYYSVTTLTQLTPLSLEKVVEHFQMTGVRIRIKTGRNGALTGHDPVGVDLLGGPVYPDQEDTMTIRLSEGLSKLWAAAGTVKLQLLYSSYPLVSTVPFTTTILSSTVYDTSEAGTDLRQLVLNLPHNIPASTELYIYLIFKTAQSVSTLSDTEYVKVYSSKETTLVMVPPQAPASGSGTQEGNPPVDTKAPVITWTVQQSAFFTRLLTLNISITEDDLDEAYFVRDGDNSLHTRLAVGDTGLMMVNRTGIKGMIIAIDEAGNTTTMPVDIPAPVTS
jgi:hypothetical protein